MTRRIGLPVRALGGGIVVFFAIRGYVTDRSGITGTPGPLLAAAGGGALIIGAGMLSVMARSGWRSLLHILVGLALMPATAMAQTTANPVNPLSNQAATPGVAAAQDRQVSAGPTTEWTTFHGDSGEISWSRQLVHRDIWDYDTGGLFWDVPFGRSQKWGAFGPARWGSPNIGAPAVIAGGLIFNGATMDSMVHAIDPVNGNVLWSDFVGTPAVANAADDVHDGRQHVAVVADGNSILKPTVGERLAVYALPQ